VLVRTKLKAEFRRINLAATRIVLGYDKGKLSREQIIQAGAAVVLAKGYAATRMADLRKPLIPAPASSLIISRRR
jgi:AcrR family transcriptional regulator